MTRSPRECVEAVLANLEMAMRLSAQKRDERMESGTNPIGAAGNYGRACAFQESISLIRTECASFLTTETKESTHA